MIRVLWDQDGVITDWTDTFKSDLATDYPHLDFEELREFSTPEWLPQEHQDAINFVKNRAGFYERMKPIPGTIEAMNEMRAYGIDVWICTSPETNNPTCASDKIAWVRRYMGDWWANRLIITRDKTLVKGDYLIDDRPEVKGAATPDWEHILFDQPYNDDVTGKRRMFHGADWYELLEGVHA